MLVQKYFDVFPYTIIQLILILIIEKGYSFFKQDDIIQVRLMLNLTYKIGNSFFTKNTSCCIVVVVGLS